MLSELVRRDIVMSGMFIAASPQSKFQGVFNCRNGAFFSKISVLLFSASWIVSLEFISWVKNLMSHMESQRESKSPLFFR